MDADTEKAVALQDYWDEVELLSNAVIGAWAGRMGRMPTREETRDLLEGLEECREERRRMLLVLVEAAAVRLELESLDEEEDDAGPD